MVVSRVCLDMLRSRTSRCDTIVGIELVADPEVIEALDLVVLA